MSSYPLHDKRITIFSQVGKLVDTQMKHHAQQHSEGQGQIIQQSY